MFIDRARGRRQSWCRPCDAEYKRDWYLKNRERHIAKARESNQRTFLQNRMNVRGYLNTHPCVNCGESDPVVLDFDHMRDKVRTISYMVLRKWRWQSIEAEIAKCEVRCANCHRRKTARERGYYRNLSIEEDATSYDYELP